MCSGSYIDKTVPPTCLPISGTISTLSVFDESVNTNMEMGRISNNNSNTDNDDMNLMIMMIECIVKIKLILK